MRQRMGTREAEFLTEDTLATAISAIGAYRGDTPLLAWLYDIACGTALRKRGGSDRAVPSGFETGSASIPPGDGRRC